MSGRKRESAVWDYYLQDILNDNSECTVLVNNKPCGRKISGRNCTNARVHLKALHKDAYQELISKESALVKKVKPSQPAPGSNFSSSSNLSMSNFLRPIVKWQPDSHEAIKRDDAFLEAIIHCGLPMRIADQPKFKEFCETLDPRYKPAGTVKLLKIMDKKMNDTKAIVKNAIASARRISLGMDIWTKKGYSSSYLAVTACFYHPKSHKAVHLLLNLHTVKHPHTGEMISEKIEGTLKDWCIEPQRIFLIITDNASNMIKSVKTLNETLESMQQEQAENQTDAIGKSSILECYEEEDMEFNEQEDGEVNLQIEFLPSFRFKRLPCLAHTIQLLFKALDKCPSYRVILTKARNIVRAVHVSSVATQKLIFKCQKTVVTDCITRWNSSYLMIKRLLDLKVYIVELFQELKWDCLLESEWAKLEEVFVLWQPFADHTNLIQTDSMALYNFLPVVLDLRCHLQDENVNPIFAGPVLQDLEERFRTYLDPSMKEFDPVPAAACVLAPDVAPALFSSEMENVLEAAKLWLIKEVTASATQVAVKSGEAGDDAEQQPSTSTENSSASAVTLSEPPENETQTVPLKRFKSLFKKLKPSASEAKDQGTMIKIEDQLLLYITEIRTKNTDETPIDFWIRNEKKYPDLAMLALDLVAAPASEAYAERIFSLCGDLTSGKRNRTSRVLESRVFLKFNMHVVEGLQ